MDDQRLETSRWRQLLRNCSLASATSEQRTSPSVAKSPRYLRHQHRLRLSVGGKPRSSFQDRAKQMPLGPTHGRPPPKSSTPEPMPSLPNVGIDQTARKSNTQSRRVDCPIKLFGNPTSLKALNRIVTAYLEFRRTIRRSKSQPMAMVDWITKAGRFSCGVRSRRSSITLAKLFAR